MPERLKFEQISMLICKADSRKTLAMRRITNLVISQSQFLVISKPSGIYRLTKCVWNPSMVSTHVIWSDKKPTPYFSSKWAPLAALFNGLTWANRCPRVPSGLKGHISVSGSRCSDAGRNSITSSTFSSTIWFLALDHLLCIWLVSDSLSPRSDHHLKHNTIVPT